MALGKAVQNLTGSLSGNIVKAVLCIRKAGKIDQNDENSIDALEASQDSVDDDIIALNEQLLKKAESALKGGKAATFSDIKSEAEKKKYIAIEVQYNPSSLRLETEAGKQMNFREGAGVEDLNLHNAPPATTLSMELLFDDVNTTDAFMLSDSLLTGLTASNAVNAVTSLTKTHSVRRQIEGLLSLLAVPTARQVIFFWGDMSFHGEVNEVQVQYTMFNKKGEPVRGKVLLRIRQGAKGEIEDADDRKRYEYDKKYWDDAFDETFKAPGAGGLMSKVSQVGSNSLLNLKL